MSDELHDEIHQCPYRVDQLQHTSVLGDLRLADQGKIRCTSCQARRGSTPMS